MKEIISDFIKITLLFYVVLMFSIYLHENVHVAIMELHTCEKADYKINYITMSGISWCDKIDVMDEEIFKQEIFLHSLNEIIGYVFIQIIIISFIWMYLFSLNQ